MLGQCASLAHLLDSESESEFKLQVQVQVELELEVERERERERERALLGNNVPDGGVQGAARRQALYTLCGQD